jgi:hypothetical protein
MSRHGPGAAQVPGPDVVSRPGRISRFAGSGALTSEEYGSVALLGSVKWDVTR